MRACCFNPTDGTDSDRALSTGTASLLAGLVGSDEAMAQLWDAAQIEKAPKRAGPVADAFRRLEEPRIDPQVASGPMQLRERKVKPPVDTPPAAVRKARVAAKSAGSTPTRGAPAVVVSSAPALADPAPTPTFGEPTLPRSTVPKIKFTWRAGETAQGNGYVERTRRFADFAARRRDRLRLDCPPASPRVYIVAFRSLWPSGPRPGTPTGLMHDDWYRRRTSARFRCVRRDRMRVGSSVPCLSARCLRKRASSLADVTGRGPTQAPCTSALRLPTPRSWLPRSTRGVDALRFACPPSLAHSARLALRPSPPACFAKHGGDQDCQAWQGPAQAGGEE